MSFFIHGIKKSVFKNSGSMNFELYIGRPVTDFENDSIKVSGVGFYDSVSDFEKSRGVKLRQLEAGYAERLISSGAFVPYKHYELKLIPDPADPLKDIVGELIPVDADIKKHFADSMK
ncbi:hypothetical protein ACOMICROBIO_GDFFDHBD_02236 [Vibrio sp. B1REV9]|uniref:DUF1293 family protein n=1 Tax=Vibrio sp. B1REV9 TaxID=2751179 RepID=UPI001AF2C633|nr:DUF1293 family protein [Vibrio sp. B1REV9]CAE6925204.1 hypothetical protein ACOMICROBIO_GDFFDHBD_02236 [Vibrio sp. B1REV9]